MSKYHTKGQFEKAYPLYRPQFAIIIFQSQLKEANNSNGVVIIETCYYGRV